VGPLVRRRHSERHRATDRLQPRQFATRFGTVEATVLRNLFEETFHDEI
jgi:hypothetical protein